MLYHLVQQSLWEEAVATDATYYPPTYHQVGGQTVGVVSFKLTNVVWVTCASNFDTDTGRLYPRDGRP